MHPEARNFLNFVHQHFPAYFTGCTGLDVGAADMTGKNRHYFDGGAYHTVTAGKLTFANNYFDTIVSSECFQHDTHYVEALQNIVRVLKPGGLFAFTCASRVTTQVGGDAQTHDYPNLTADDVQAAIPVATVFERYQFYENEASHDLYFWGIKRPPPATLSEAFARAGTDKGPAFHNYGVYYEPYLSPFRAKPIKLLEIGVADGKSLRAWRAYFHNATAIVGVDVDADCEQHAEPSAGIHVFTGNQRDFAFLRAVHQEHGPFDIVVDDGSDHRLDRIASFNALFPLLQDGGVYVVENTVCMREDIHYFTCHLAQHLNKWRYDGTQEVKDHCVDPAKIERTVTDPGAHSVGDIVITNAAILIHKRVKKHWLPILLPATA